VCAERVLTEHTKNAEREDYKNLQRTIPLQRNTPKRMIYDFVNLSNNPQYQVPERKWMVSCKNQGNSKKMKLADFKKRSMSPSDYPTIYPIRQITTQNNTPPFCIAYLLGFILKPHC
jgi:hypothetical protein